MIAARMLVLGAWLAVAQGARADDGALCADRRGTAEARLAACGRLIAGSGPGETRLTEWRFNHADSLNDVGRFAEARAEADALLTGPLRSAGRLWRLSAAIDLNLNQRNQALADLGHALQLDAKDARALSMRGEIKRQMDDPVGAREDFLAATREDEKNAYAWRGLADLEAEGKAFDKALDYMAKARAAEPGDAALAREEGAILEDADRATEAMAVYEALIAADPKDAVTLTYRAINRLGRSDAAGALADAEAAIRLRPDYWRGHWARGAVLRARGDNAAARRELDLALQAKPDSESALRDRSAVLLDLGEGKAAEADASRLIAQNAKDADAYFKRARAREKQKAFKDSVADYDAYLKLRPKDVDALFNRGLMRSKAGDHAGAAADLEAARAIAPEAETLLNLALEYDALGKIEPELKLYHEILASNPGNADALADLAITLGEQKRWKEALPALDEALKVNPKNAGLWAWRGDTLDALDQSDKAFEAYARALSIDPHDRGGLWGHGRLARARKLYDVALADFDRLIADKPDDVDAKDAAVNVLFDRGDKAKAIERVRAYLKDAPDQPTLLVDLGHFQWEKDDNAAALETLDKALAKAPENTNALYYRALSWRDLKHADKAIADLRRMMRIDPEDPDGPSLLGSIYMDMDDAYSARLYADKALALNPKQVYALETRAKALRAMGEEAAAKRDEAAAKALKH
jgi:tetratricopeptide (TPR) repeat protein